MFALLFPLLLASWCVFSVFVTFLWSSALASPSFGEEMGPGSVLLFCCILDKLWSACPSLLYLLTTNGRGVADTSVVFEVCGGAENWEKLRSCGV